jgi:hypothetical protein
MHKGCIQFFMSRFGDECHKPYFLEPLFGVQDGNKFKSTLLFEKTDG